MDNNRIGLFGGTFDPPHIGHLILASEASHQFGLSRLLWALASAPPHKLDKPITPLEHRIAMVEMAIAGEPIFEFSNIEINRPGPHYTADTVDLLMDEQPGLEIVLLLGGDSLHSLPSWHRPIELVSRIYQLGVLQRPGEMFDMQGLEEKIPGIGQKTTFIEALLHNLSSSEIRRRVKNGLPYRYYVLPSIFEYIESRGLYRDG